jgi:hypothetical protein
MTPETYCYLYYLYMNKMARSDSKKQEHTQYTRITILMDVRV